MSCSPLHYISVLLVWRAQMFAAQGARCKIAPPLGLSWCGKLTETMMPPMRFVYPRKVNPKTSPGANHIGDAWFVLASIRNQRDPTKGLRRDCANIATAPFSLSSFTPKHVENKFQN